MTRFLCIVSVTIAMALTLSCDRGARSGKSKKTSLAEARKGHVTKITRKESDTLPPAEPPQDVLQLVQYQSPAGAMSAYLSRAPDDSQKHPAIIWLFGGFGNGIGETAWEPQPADNDQSAVEFRRSGVITMYPALRGGSGNPGTVENFYGEVDDVLAAADFLAKQKGVDPSRIYLGGHSTGGTLALLVAECSDRFRAVFACGPAHDIAAYGAESLVFNAGDKREVELRSPIHWLEGIKSPVFVFEGDDREANIEALRAMDQATSNAAVRFCPIRGGDHFSILKPLTKALAERILADTGSATNISFSKEDLQQLMEQY